MQEMKMRTKQKKEEERGEKVKVDGMEVKVKAPSPSKVRPAYYCQKCNRSFPSQLDLEEHKKIDHKSTAKR
jgi:hypothetical protein